MGAPFLPAAVALLLAAAAPTTAPTVPPRVVEGRVAIQGARAPTRPVRVEGHLQRWGPLPADWGSQVLLSRDVVTRLQKDADYQKAVAAQPAAAFRLITVKVDPRTMRFVAPDAVAPGIYSLSFTAREEQGERRGAVIMGRGHYVVAVTASEGADAAPLELGALEVAAHKYLRVGDEAPEFDVPAVRENADGVKLSAYRGQWVVVDFWATWCGPCVEELRAMPSVVKANPDVVFISLSFDEERDAAAKMVDKESWNWQQGWLGDWFKSPVREQWGLEVVGTVFVVDPDGKIAAAGDATKLVERFLAERSPPAKR